MEIPAEQLKVVEGLATSGDTSAKDMISKLGPQSAPAKAEEKQEINAQPAAPDKPEAPEGVKTDEGKSGVDVGRDRNGEERGPSKIDTIRDLRRERRELRAELSALREKDKLYTEKLTSLEQQLKALPNGKPTQSTDEDDLARLLSKPSEYLSERDKAILDKVQKLVDERFRQVPTMLQGLTKSQQEKSQAIETLKSIKDFDLDRDQEQVLEIMEEEYLLDEQDVEEMLIQKPVKTANLIKRAWEKKYSLPAPAKIDKAAAASGVAPGLATPAVKPSLQDLNAQFRNAASSEEKSRILKQMEMMTSS